MEVKYLPLEAYRNKCSKEVLPSLTKKPLLPFLTVIHEHKWDFIFLITSSPRSPNSQHMCSVDIFI